MAGSDGRRVLRFHVSIRDKQGKAGGNWKEILCAFLAVLSLGLGVVKEKWMDGERKGQSGNLKK